MDLSKEFGIDDELAESGRWIRVDDETELFVAALPNKAYDAFLELPRRQAREMGKDTLPTATFEEALAMTVLLSWRGLTDKGERLEPTPPNRLSMIKKYPRFQNLVITLARDNKNFQRKHDEAEAKNSESGLNGSSELAHISAH